MVSESAANASERPPLAGHLIVSFGLPKSASTYAWRLLKDMAIAGGAPVITLSSAAKGLQSNEDYVEALTSERLQAIRDEASDGCVVVKTHNEAPPLGAIEAAGFRGYTVFVQHRDPREIALSLIDHGNRSRAMGIEDFVECANVTRCLWTIDLALTRMATWIARGEAHPVSYDALCFDGEATVARMAEVLGLVVDAGGILAPYGDRTRIGQFNKGVPDRWRSDMSADDVRLVLDTFREYYQVYG